MFAACAGCYDCPTGALEDSLAVVLHYQLLAGSPTGAALYAGSAGENGTLFKTLTADYFASGDTMYVRIAPGDCGMLMGGSTYVVIATDAYPDGEVRGQLDCFITPVMDRSWGSIRTLFR
jgi:hypothetical protein